MVKRKIEWSPDATEDLKDILSFYIERNGNKSYSNKLFKQIKRIISYLKDNNYLGKATDGKNIRVIFYQNYKILYEIKRVTIEIQMIWDMRRSPEDLE